MTYLLVPARTYHKSGKREERVLLIPMFFSNVELDVCNY